MLLSNLEYNCSKFDTYSIRSMESHKKNYFEFYSYQPNLLSIIQSINNYKIRVHLV